MHLGVSGAFAVCMQPCSLVDVFGVPGVEASVGAEEDVHVKRHGRMRS
jgi:hypothetical protein